jgi:protein gp37
MNKSKIEWCDYTINPVKGLCPVACDYCYARRLYKRFKWPESIEFQYAHFRKSVSTIKMPSKIFVGSMMELFGAWIMDRWLADIFDVVRLYPRNTFIFLTKKPENLPQDWPENCWVGVSVPTQWCFDEAVIRLSRVHASVKFLSFEPLCDRIFIQPTQLIAAGVKWVILGRETPSRKREHLPWQWFKEVVDVADSAGIPVFLKNNLAALLPAGSPFMINKFPTPLFQALHQNLLRQEFPKGV